MNPIEIVSYIKYYLELILTAHMRQEIDIMPQDVDELLRVRELVADLCDKYGLDRFQD